MRKRSKVTNNEIMDALDATGFSLLKASKLLGVGKTTLFKWVNADPTLKAYRSQQLGLDAVKARDVLNNILENADHMDTRVMGHVISVCKLLLDKAEADKQDMNVSHEHKIDKELDAKINKLMDG